MAFSMVLGLYLIVGIHLAGIVYWLDVRRALKRGFTPSEIKEYMYFDSVYKPSKYDKLESHFIPPPYFLIFIWGPALVIWVMIGVWKMFNWLVFKSASETIDDDKKR